MTREGNGALHPATVLLGAYCLFGMTMVIVAVLVVAQSVSHSDLPGGPAR